MRYYKGEILSQLFEGGWGWAPCESLNLDNSCWPNLLFIIMHHNDWLNWFCSRCMCTKKKVKIISSPPQTQSKIIVYELSPQPKFICTLLSANFLLKMRKYWYCQKVMYQTVKVIVSDSYSEKDGWEANFEFRCGALTCLYSRKWT